MNEFLTENARRAYPLAHELPDGLPAVLGELLVDASVSCDLEAGEDDAIRLVSVLKMGSAVFVKLGLSDTSACIVGLVPGTRDHETYYGSDTHFKAFLTVRTAALREILDSEGIPVGTLWEPHVPLAIRCVSFAIPRVTAVEAYASPLCTKPAFRAAARTPTVVAGGHVVLVAKDGLDLERVSDPLVGDVLRVSALAADADAAGDATPVDLRILGDDCFTVEAIPSAKVAEGGAIVPWDDPAEPPYADANACGVIRLGQKCKPCCQCEDYRDAAEALRPGATAAATLKAALDVLKAAYDDICGEFAEYKEEIEAAINDYPNVHAYATAVCSGGVYSGVSAAGNRCRVAVTLTVANMTLVDATVTPSSLGVSVSGYSAVKVAWNQSGSVVRGGTSIPSDTDPWVLRPGDTVNVVWTLAKPGDTNEATKPAGMTATFDVLLSNKTVATTKTVEVR